MRFARYTTCGLVLVSFAAQVGCEPSYTYAGYDMPDHFPMDGSTREWTYASTDISVTDGLVIEKADSSVEDGVEVITLEHWTIGEDDTEDDIWITLPVD